MQFRLGKVAIASGIGLVTIFGMTTLWLEGLHRYRVWRSDDT
ncbi:MAG: hypothetical protein AAFQ89_08520 [Cyanobacteria bacterium J06626_18]